DWIVDGRSLKRSGPRSIAVSITLSPRSYWRRPFFASASALSWGSTIKSGSSARLCLCSGSGTALLFFGEQLSLLVHHFPSNARVFKCCVAVSKAAPLLLSLLLRGLNCLRRLDQSFKSACHSVFLHLEPKYSVRFYLVPASHRVVNKIKASTSGDAAAAPFPLLPPGAYIEPCLPSPAKAPPSG